MMRRGSDGWLLAVFFDDPRMRLMPLAAQGLWLRVAMTLQSMPETAGFRLGSEFINRLLVLVSEEETQLGSADATRLETHLENLIKAGFLTRHDDGSIEIPDSMPATDRVTAARENGARGGRPRRGETAEQAAARRARDAMAMSAASDAETQKTQHETQASKAPRARATAATAKESKQAYACAPDDLSFGRVVAQSAGLEDGCDVGPVLDWLAQGIDRGVILATVRGVVARPNYRVPRTLGYFSAAIREAPAGGSVMSGEPDIASDKRPSWWRTWAKRIGGGRHACAASLSDRVHQVDS
jgi:hypothetical protein